MLDIKETQKEHGFDPSIAQYKPLQTLQPYK